MINKSSGLINKSSGLINKSSGLINKTIGMSSDTSPSKCLTVTIPDYAITSPRSESTSLSSKMRKILSSPKVSKGKPVMSPNKTFGVPLEFLYDRDNTDVPVIVTRICEYLKSNGVCQEGLFRVNGNMKVVDRLKIAFDKCGDADLEEIGDVPAAASLLKMFLRELSDPVIPEDLQSLFISVQDQYCKEKKKAIPLMKELVMRMPQGNAYLLQYLCQFMLVIASESDVNKMTPLALAIVFGPNIFRCGEGLDGLRDQAYVNAVLLLMLQEYDEIFVVDNDMFPGSTLWEAPGKPLPYIEHMQNKKKEGGEQKEKPARPPPPRLNLDDGVNDEVVSSPVTSPKRSPRKNSPKRSSKRKSPKQSPTHGHKSTAKKKLPAGKEVKCSSSPTYNNTSSPLSKQLVDNTINKTVKEHLFGPGLVISSTESDIQDEQVHHESSEEVKVYPSVKDCVKNFSDSESNLLDGHLSPTKKLKSLDVNKLNITDEDLEYIDEHSNRTLEGLSSSRAPPPKNRCKPSLTHSVRSEITENAPTSSQDFSLASRGLEMNMGSNKTIMEISKDRKPEITSQITKKNTKSSEKLKSLRSSVTPLQKSKSVPPLSSSTPDAIEPLTLNAIRALDVQRIQDGENEAQRSPRESYYMSSYEGPLCSSHSAPSSPGRTEKRHEMWLQKRQDTVPNVDMSPQDLRKRINALKRIVSNFEANFEQLNGRKPKPSEKIHIQKYIAELGRAKRQLKELISDYKENPELLSETALVGPEHGKAPNLREIVDRNDEPTKDETLASLLKKLEDKRLASGRPHEIQLMTMEQLKDEKLAVQKALLQYENLHGRPTSKEDKTLMHPLYDRYRKIKRVISTGKMTSPAKLSETGSIFPDAASTPKRIIDNSVTQDKDVTTESTQNERNVRVPHIPTAPENYDEQSITYEDREIHAYRDLNDTLGDTFSVTNRFQDTPEPLSPPTDDSPRSIDEAVLHDATIGELLEQQRSTKRAKKRLGKLLKEYEDEFFDTWNRKVQKEDRLPKEAEYREYKLIKAKLRLVEALIAKKSANQTV